METLKACSGPSKKSYMVRLLSTQLKSINFEAWYHYYYNLLNIKRGVAQWLVRRAEEVTTTEELKKKEIRHLVTALRGNGYPTNFVQPTKRKRKDDTLNAEEEENKPLTTAIIPYTPKT